VSILGFAGSATLVAFLIHLYLWKRLVRDTTPAGRLRRLGTVVITLLGLLIPATLVGTRMGGLTLLAWPGYLWIALMFYLLIVLLALEVPMLIARLVLRRRTDPAVAVTPAAVGAPASSATSTGQVGSASAEPALTAAAVPDPARATTPAAPTITAEGGDSPPGSPAPADPGHDPSRRLLLARGAAIFAGLTAVGITGYGVRTATGPLRVERVQVPLAKLPRRMDGLRIATVSDIHIGPLTGRARIEHIVETINRLDPDLVAVVGDLVDGTVAELGADAAPLRNLSARYGSFFVTGNHEYYSGAEEWIAEVDRLGLRVLQNERREIVTPGGVLDLAGVNDIAAETMPDTVGPDYAAALGDRDPDRPVVLMAHQPVAVHEAAKYGVDLQLSGHTHGGQLYPFDYVVKLEQPVVSGLATIDGTQVYVTNGAGFWGPPVRVGAPPEVTLVELRAR
jgi:predicted MPP superfamily phosphohydrolase